MDLSAISGSLVDTTMKSAKFAKAEKTANDFRAALEEAGKKVNSEDVSKEDDEALKTMCKEFEKYFLEEMYKSMRSTLNTEKNLLYGGQAEDIFQSQLDQQYVDAAVEAGGIGLAKQLYNQLRSPSSSTGADLNNKLKEAEEASEEVKLNTENSIEN